MVGPLPDGTTYGPFGFNNNAGGTTGWVTTCYTFTTGGTFRFVWEVANVFGSQGGDALATDNITLNGTKIVQFQPGGLAALRLLGAGQLRDLGGGHGAADVGRRSRVCLARRPTVEQHGCHAAL